ncbi:hypothetical protein MBLNU230_g0724t1 [Neophaeotheca triangularis]
MHRQLLPLLATALGSTALPYELPFHQDYSTWMADSMVNRGIEGPEWDSRGYHYTNAVFYRGLEYAYNKTNDPKYLSEITTHIDQLLTPNGTFISWNREPGAQKSLDDILIGNSVLFLHQLHPNNTAYTGAADFLHTFLLEQSRTPSGGFWHRDDRYEDQMWLDGIYMADVFYAHYVSLFQPSNTTAWDDILLQFELIESRTRNETSGLMVHGYDEARDEVWSDPETGAAPHVWNRALGWYFMALVDVLDYFPADHRGREVLMAYYTDLAEALVRAQDPESHGWWLIMDEPYPGMEGNYIESSGSAMFVYGFLKGLRKGYLSENEYAGPAQMGYELLTDDFTVANGTNCTLNWLGTVEVGSLSGDGDYEYYISVPLQQNDLKGVGPFIYASAEIEARNGLWEIDY